MFEVSELSVTGTRREVLHRAETFEAAKAHVNATYSVICMEDDSDHAGCADAYTATGRVLCIQPENFRIS